jgi:anti-sigma regulatory factor (Ser/Thr protein kinase)
VLPDLRAFVEGAAVYSGLGAEDTFAYKLAVDELCANIIQYGYAGREPGQLSVAFEVDGANGRMFIQDNGHSFAPDQAPPPDLQGDWEQRELGGLGLYFVKELMDSVAYTQVAPNFNQVRLEKSLASASLRKE